jgi:hypothetical protein
MNQERDEGVERRESLEEMLLELRAAAKERKSPTRHEARDLLLALGAAMRAEDTRAIEAAAEALKELEASSSTFRDRWRAAVAEELSLACTEHVRSVEPRYIDHPRYDFEYTISARDRLELRLRAAEKLGHAVAEGWMSQVTRADALLATALARRSKRASDPGQGRRA